MKRFRWYYPVIGVLVLLLAGSILYVVAWSRPLTPRASEEAEIEEEVGTAQATAPAPPTAGSWVAGNCVIEPLGQEREVASETPGRIAEIPVEEGDRVQAGDLLVQLDAATELAAVQAAHGEVAEAEATLSLRQAGTRAEEIQSARAEARAARAQAQLSQGVFERLEQAYESGGVTRDELDRARHQAQADAQAAEAAQARLRQALAGPRQQEIGEAAARLEAARAQLEQAQTELDSRSIEAPIAGEVLEVVQLVGEYYQPGQPLVILGDTRSLRARMEVDERDIAAVEAGADARVWVPDRTYDASVISVGQRVKPKSILSEDPGDPTDVRVLEVLLDIEGTGGLVVGQRGVCYVAAAGERVTLVPPRRPNEPPRIDYSAVHAAHPPRALRLPGRARVRRREPAFQPARRHGRRGERRRRRRARRRGRPRPLGYLARGGADRPDL